MGGEILLVEDEESLSRAVSLKLAKEGYMVHTAFSLEEARGVYAGCRPKLILCDITLPDGSGLDFCEEIRKESQAIFLFLTAMDTEIDMINGYEAGADDYITKPFSLAVLISKVNAIMRRRQQEEAKTAIYSGSIVFLLEESRAKKNGEYLSLTAKEQRLLSYFMENPKRILSKRQLLEAIWDVDGNFVDENTLAVNIRRLREKIEDDPGKPSAIKNVRGLGYIWERDCEWR